MKGTKTVWVLGSGFSRSLGGPLLHELISQKTAEETREVFPKLGKREVVYRVYERGFKTLWSHAEEFLDYVDSALLSDSPRRKIFTRRLETVVNEVWGRPDPSYSVEQFRDEAILTVAAECSTYTANCDVRSEAWAPYVDWAGKLGESDTIITFNYDLVLETIGIAKEVRSLGSPTVAFPKGDTEGTLHKLTGAGICPIYKLHGSADWAFKDGFPTKRISGLHEAMQDDGYRPLIATPGATKTRYVNKMLRRLWSDALDAIKEAEVVVFIGYRFPPSDSEARTRILSAIEENKSPFLKIHTVLGPDVNQGDAQRLKGLLTHKLRAAKRVDASNFDRMNDTFIRLPLMYDVVAQPLLAEDFLTVVHQGELFDSNIANAIRQSLGPSAG